MIKNCSNGRSLLVTDIEFIVNEFEANWTPFVVLLSACGIELINSEKLAQLVKLLLAKGAKNIVCVGEYSERLHDEVDEILYGYDEKLGIASTVLTTFHDDEPLEDSLNYFVHGTELPKSEGYGLLALVGSDDNRVLELLKIA